MEVDQKVSNEDTKKEAKSKKKKSTSVMQDVAKNSAETKGQMKPKNTGVVPPMIQNFSMNAQKDAQEENIKVAVRVRPFNKRETERKSKLIVDMQGTQTVIKSLSDANKSHTFAFDYSYWSYDGCKADSNGYWTPDPSHANSKKYCDQKRVFDDLGKLMYKLS